ncbi:hypothetical protein GCM10011608_34960 [Micromonospora sonchi]|uniref:Uncharacterized protein n=1 Tax=Micromonospora sonchi TaxID=1763543 RepID=A0A917U0P8_9ACTN|nr:hypothetical protein [Micromonospora sonchi]GGM47236.1 hypothetical protein GCM10011608_34960 [Micromonospora sonchi]
MSLVPAETDDRVLLIANDDTFAHTYLDFHQMLAEQSEGDELRGAVEFFDTAGRRLVPKFDPQWRLTDLRPSSEPADPAAVRRRLEAVRDHLERFLRANPELLASYRLDVAEAVGALPVLDGTLTDAINEMPWHERSHRGNFLHNAMHAAGWA